MVQRIREDKTSEALHKSCRSRRGGGEREKAGEAGGSMQERTSTILDLDPQDKLPASSGRVARLQLTASLWCFS
jgi:hypothetical protein